MGVEAPGWLTSSWAKVLGALGVYGTLTGLGIVPLPAAIIAVSVGFLSGQLQLALAVALVISLCVNLFLVVVLTRRRRGGQGRPARHPRPQAFAVDGELDSIMLTSADLEAWWANMLAVARERVGPDARASVGSIHIDSAFIHFRGESVAAMKSFSGTVAGPDPRHVSWYGINRKDKPWEHDPAPPLWRTDDTWRDLVKKAWIRERPTRSLCVLYQANSGTHRYWRLIFGPYQTEDEQLVRAREYVLIDGQLAVSAPTA